MGKLNTPGESIGQSLRMEKRLNIYLLDQAMQMEKIGLISTNLAER